MHTLESCLGLQSLYLRLGTDDTPIPYFHPLLVFRGFSTLRSLSLVQIDREDMLESVGNLLGETLKLEHLMLDVDPDSGLTMDILLGPMYKAKKTLLTSLRLYGFAGPGILEHPKEIGWAVGLAPHLTSLTLEIRTSQDVDHFEDFWYMIQEYDVRLTSIRTNLLCEGFILFLASYSSLEKITVTPFSEPSLANMLSRFLDVLANGHARTLRVLGVLPQDPCIMAYNFDAVQVESVMLACAGLHRLGFPLDGGTLVSTAALFGNSCYQALSADLS
jgi:hypothetical protein